MLLKQNLSEKQQAVVQKWRNQLEKFRSDVLMRFSDYKVCSGGEHGRCRWK
jgi:hypothetical protein